MKIEEIEKEVIEHSERLAIIETKNDNVTTNIEEIKTDIKKILTNQEKSEEKVREKIHEILNSITFSKIIYDNRKAIIWGSVCAILFTLINIGLDIDVLKKVLMP